MQVEVKVNYPSHCPTKQFVECNYDVLITITTGHSIPKFTWWSLSIMVNFSLGFGLCLFSLGRRVGLAGC